MISGRQMVAERKEISRFWHDSWSLDRVADRVTERVQKKAGRRLYDQEMTRNETIDLLVFSIVAVLLAPSSSYDLSFPSCFFSSISLLRFFAWFGGGDDLRGIRKVCVCVCMCFLGGLSRRDLVVVR